MLARHAGLVTLALAIAAGCSLAFDPLEYAGGVRDGGAADGSTTPPVTDAGPGGADGALDATVDADASASFCPPPAPGVFCDDFERATPKGSWPDLSELNGTAAIVKEDGNSFLRTTMTNAANTEGVVGLFKGSMGTPTTRARLGFRVRVPSPVANYAQAGVIGFGSQPDTANFVLYKTPTSFEVFEQRFGAGAGFWLHGLSPTPPAGEWSRVELTVTFPAGQTSKIEVTVDGAVALNKSSDALFTRSPVAAGVGLTYANPATACALDVDDVLVQVE